MKGITSYSAFGSSSKTLKDAVSPQQYFDTSVNCWNPDCEVMVEPNITGVNQFISSKFIPDYENDFYYNENGAVLDAIDLSIFFNNKEEQIKKILSDCIEKYPEYVVEVKEENFPMFVDGGTVDRYGGWNNESQEIYMSSHVLYIKNYKDFIKKPKEKIK